MSAVSSDTPEGRVRHGRNGKGQRVRKGHGLLFLPIAITLMVAAAGCPPPTTVICPSCGSAGDGQGARTYMLNPGDALPNLPWLGDRIIVIPDESPRFVCVNNDEVFGHTVYPLTAGEGYVELVVLKAGVVFMYGTPKQSAGTCQEYFDRHMYSGEERPPDGGTTGP